MSATQSRTKSSVHGACLLRAIKIPEHTLHACFRDWFDATTKRVENSVLALCLPLFWPAGRGLGGVQGSGGCGELAGRGGSGEGDARGPSLYVQLGFEAIYNWKQHTVLT